MDGQLQRHTVSNLLQLALLNCICYDTSIHTKHCDGRRRGTDNTDAVEAPTTQ